MEILSLGEKIKQKRKELNMTLKDLAGDKVTPGQISLVESGKSKPSIDLLEYIARSLKVSIDYLLETEEHQAENLCLYYSKVIEASLLAGNYEQAREAISKCMAYSKQYGLEYYMGLSELYMGKIEYGQGNYESAQSLFISSNEIFFKIGSTRDIIDAYINLGKVAYKLSHFNSSLIFYRQAERILSENKLVDNEILMNIYFNISQCYSKLGNYSESIDYLLLALEKFKEKNDKSQYGQSLLMLSISYKSMGMFEEALLYANRAVEVFRELNNFAFMARIETNMGEILSDIGSIEDSFKHLEESYKIKQEIKDKTIIYTILKMADNYIKLNEIDRALDIIKDAYEKYSEEISNEYRISLYYYLYKLYMMKKDEKNAELYLLEAVKYLQNMDMPKELADVYITLGELYQSIGMVEEALRFINKGISIYKELGIILSKCEKQVF